ncbi:uncharacterized protein LOC127034809 [Gopherus flavomarginatus]|uniref:uncharacterized protein LOC127034809 n=1 Tax=Gopherus flavomarginatus TaxID=286002 RepID=UPI0021CBFB16|nr:uncharacterized protein LOC127034809 [Gopherus flavomarginatus]
MAGRVLRPGRGSLLRWRLPRAPGSRALLRSVPVTFLPGPVRHFNPLPSSPVANKAINKCRPESGSFVSACSSLRLRAEERSGADGTGGPRGAQGSPLGAGGRCALWRRFPCEQCAAGPQAGGQSTPRLAGGVGVKDFLTPQLKCTVSAAGCRGRALAPRGGAGMYVTCSHRAHTRLPLLREARGERCLPGLSPFGPRGVVLWRT